VHSSNNPEQYENPYLVLGEDEEATWKSMAQFSERDADNYADYEKFLGKVREMVSPILDHAPPIISSDGSWRDNASHAMQIQKLLQVLSSCLFVLLAPSQNPFFRICVHLTLVAPFASHR
jgi:hypothetical protein